MPERIAVDGCMVVNRAELDAAVDAATRGADAVGWRQGFVFGMITAAVGVALVGAVAPGPFSATEMFVSLMCGAAAAALVLRIWDASGATFTLGWWSVADFAASLKGQWDREASEEHGG